ncbi:methyltransferase domain-containing protein [Micromonospora sp. NPDC049044]|uniref:methyltransferase domain-containing protein n=1 Tax=unclassified Micromonospora TaxID=2617518 RepID=UPI0033FC38E1
MPTDHLATSRYRRMRWNTPLSEEHAALLLQRLEVHPGARVLDLGCGWGELLLRAVTAGGVAGPVATRGVGVDTDDAVLTRGRRLAADRSLSRHVAFVMGDVAAWQEPADRVLCIGSAHAFGGTRAALDALAAVVRPGGRLLFGDAYWDRPPTPQVEQIFGTEVTALPELVEAARERGWRVLHVSTADQREWDDFESTWLAGRQEWLLAYPEDPRAAEVRAELDDRLREYVGGYRGILGLAYLVLGR